jgi:hypothetical protein
MSGPLAGDPVPDIETGKFKFGTQVRDLKSLLATYDGEIYVVPLINNPTAKTIYDTITSYALRIEVIKSILTTFFQKNESTWYQMNIFRLLASVFPFLRKFRSLFPFSKYWVMCSTYTAEAYTALGIIPNTVNPQDVLPISFCYLQMSDEIPKGIFCPNAQQLTL